MGMNYYLESPPCPHCGNRITRKHIGKSSIGMRFIFEAHANIFCFKDWMKEILDPKKIIRNEEGSIVSVEAFTELVEGKKEEKSHSNPFKSVKFAESAYYPEDDIWIDEDGYEFTENEFS